jgi:hypothetical protein
VEEVGSDRNRHRYRPSDVLRPAGSPDTGDGLRSILYVIALDGIDDPLGRFSEEVAQRCDGALVLLDVIPSFTSSGEP